MRLRECVFPSHSACSSLYSTRTLKYWSVALSPFTQHHPKKIFIPLNKNSLDTELCWFQMCHFFENKIINSTFFYFLFTLFTFFFIFFYLLSTFFLSSSIFYLLAQHRRSSSTLSNTKNKKSFSTFLSFFWERKVNELSTFLFFPFRK